MFSSFIQCGWSSDAKGVVYQLWRVLHMTAGCDSVTVVNMGTGTTSSTSLFSFMLHFLGKGCLIKVLLAFFSSTSYHKFKVGTEFV